MAIYLVQTIVHGIVFDGVLTNGFNHLDAFELKDWIRKHAEAVALFYPLQAPDPVAAAEALADSPIVRGSYDYVFGYADGDINRPSQGAGTALRGFLRLAFGYKGHLFYAMRGGMGDVVIAPLYQVLAKRGVKFEFFNRVERLVPGGGEIEAVEMSRQARLAGASYQPLLDVALPGWKATATLPCWPSEPLWDQLQDADRLKGVEFEAPWGPALETRTLTRGVDAAREQNGGPTYVCSDVRDYRPDPASFDAMVILSQSFGYFDPDTNRALVARLGEALRLGGRLVLDLWNPDFFFPRQGQRSFELPAGSVVETKRMEDGRLFTRLDYPGGGHDAFEFQTFTEAEMASFARPLGMILVAACTDFDAAVPPSAEKPRIQFVLERRS